MHQRWEATRNVFKKDRRRNLEIDYYAIVYINAIGVQLAEAALVNSVFIYVQENMEAGGQLNKQRHTFYLLQTQFFLNRYQEVGEKPANTATRKKLLEVNLPQPGTIWPKHAFLRDE